MPGLNGREVLRRMRQAGNWTPVLFLSYVGPPRNGPSRCWRGPTIT
ncbi:hypothetical protein [Thermoflexus sp.]